MPLAIINSAGAVTVLSSRIIVVASSGAVPLNSVKLMLKTRATRVKRIGEQDQQLHAQANQHPGWDTFAEPAGEQDAESGREDADCLRVDALARVVSQDTRKMRRHMGKEETIEARGAGNHGAAND